jgi:hypothetical protein
MLSQRNFDFQVFNQLVAKRVRIDFDWRQDAFPIENRLQLIFRKERKNVDVVLVHDFAQIFFVIEMISVVTMQHEKRTERSKKDFKTLDKRRDFKVNRGHSPAQISFLNSISARRFMTTLVRIICVRQSTCN